MALTLDEYQKVRAACVLYHIQGQRALKFTLDKVRKARERRFTSSTIELVIYVLATMKPEFIQIALDAIDADCVAIFDNTRAACERFKA